MCSFERGPSASAIVPADLRAADASRQFDDRPLESGDGGVVIAANVFGPPPGAADQKLFSLLMSFCLLSIGSVIADANCGQFVPRPFARLRRDAPK